MAMFAVVAIALSFSTPAFAGSFLGQERIISMPMQTYSEDCGKESSLRLVPEAASFLQGQNVPGAGILKGDFKPYNKVLKDGYQMVDCVKDYMFYRGDKFGDNKHDYKLGPVSNVSIVHYSALVDRNSKQPIEPKVCFDFCRTIPNMGFFGIRNGRDCYCTPYFTGMESDNSMCDAPCEGDDSMVCGGNSKSSIFAMHMCHSLGEDLKLAVDEASTFVADAKTRVLADGKACVKDMTKVADILKAAFGNVGDSGVTDLAQTAKINLNQLDYAVLAADRTTNELSEILQDASAQAGAVKSDPKKAKDAKFVIKAEGTLDNLEETLAQDEVAIDKIEKEIIKLSRPRFYDQSADSTVHYYPIMYFIDKKYGDVPTGGKAAEFTGVPVTCTGDLIKPVYRVDKLACAAACDEVGLYSTAGCVGYQFFGDKWAVKGGEGMCFLYSKFRTGVYYTGCKDKADTASTGCYGKLSKFNGVSLKPDPKDKCIWCFKSMKKANRCPKPMA
jgi:hypothetical protein